MAVAPLWTLNLNESPSHDVRSIDCFERLEKIGEGTYGQVFMACEKGTNEIVALKKIRMDNEKEGFPITAIREIKLLKKLHHENVIRLKEIVTSPGPEDVEKGKPSNAKKYKGSTYMVFDYMDHDLAGLMSQPNTKFTGPQIKCYMKQLLTGLHYCHANHVLHRDIKGPNLLIDNQGNLKLADFGLARQFSGDPDGKMTNRVITLWYRPLELLLGTNNYGPAVDMWSAGCIFGELLNGKPIMPGNGETDQITRIFSLCGTPDEVNWPGVSMMPWYTKFKPSMPKKSQLREVFRHLDYHALDLLEMMLTLDPAQRISAKVALDANYFWTDPLPCDPKSLPKYKSSHEYQTRKNRRLRQQKEAAKRQKLQHLQPHAYRPSIQPAGQLHSQIRPPDQPMHSAAPAMLAHSTHHHYKADGPSGRPSRDAQSEIPGSGYNPHHHGQGGGYGGGPYSQQGFRPPLQYAGSGMPPGTIGPSGGRGYYGVDWQNYTSVGPHNASGAGRPPTYHQAGRHNHQQQQR